MTIRCSATREFVSVMRFTRLFRHRKWLKFAPRKALLHKQPLIGRFAPFLRSKEYLWSFRETPVRTALYVGSVLSLWPVMGIQLFLSFVVAVLFRANVLVVAALQFITNPLTAGPIYYGTYKLGMFLLGLVGVHSDQEDKEGADLAATSDLLDPSTLGIGAVALFVGGTVVGLVIAVILDIGRALIAGQKTGVRAQEA